MLLNQIRQEQLKNKTPNGVFTFIRATEFAACALKGKPATLCTPYRAKVKKLN